MSLFNDDNWKCYLFLFFNNQETSWKTEETFKSFKDKKKSE